MDIPTVSRWLGHKDGGALAMKVYGHLREEHSFSMIKRVAFTKSSVENVLEMPASAPITAAVTQEKRAPAVAADGAA